MLLIGFYRLLWAAAMTAWFLAWYAITLCGSVSPKYLALHVSASVVRLQTIVLELMIYGAVDASLLKCDLIFLVQGYGVPY